MSHLRSRGSATGGVIEVWTGPPNGDRAVIRLTEGQWGKAKVRKLPHGIEIEFRGDMELRELGDFFVLFGSRGKRDQPGSVCTCRGIPTGESRP